MSIINYPLWRHINATCSKTAPDYVDAFKLKDSELSSMTSSYRSNNPVKIENITEKVKNIICEFEKNNYTCHKNSSLLEINLQQAVNDANLETDLLEIIVDDFPHHSLFFKNNCYNDSSSRMIIYQAIIDNIIQHHELKNYK
ncbi:hypothetical protein [Acinetobacter sp. 3657]|uniref:hypothetical protein n=1 Tax=Acinetobacter sp. 3657 TaxID=2817764 RepID=UPI002854400E|nr:GTPase Era involved in 16S rRNA processing [Prolinoborus sp. 3657]